MKTRVLRLLIVLVVVGTVMAASRLAASFYGKWTMEAARRASPIIQPLDFGAVVNAGASTIYQIASLGGTTSAPSVTWSATGGTITASGLYTAGSTTGTFAVIASGSNGLADTSFVEIIAPALGGDPNIPQVEDGTALLEIPDTMELGDIYTVRLAVSTTDTMPTNGAATRVARISVASRMTASIHARSLDPGPSAQERPQARSISTGNTWSWEVSPRNRGRQPFVIRLNAVTEDGAETALTEFAGEVVVTESLVHRFLYYIGHNWELIFLVLVSAPAIALRKRIVALWNGRASRRVEGFRP